MKRNGRYGKTAVCVGTITDDLRLFEVPKLKVKLINSSFFFIILWQMIKKITKTILLVVNNDRNDAKVIIRILVT